MEDASVVMDDGVYRVQVDSTLVVVQCLVKFACTLHVDAHVLEDAELPGIIPHGILILVESLRAISELLIDDSKVHFSFEMIRLESEHLIKKRTKLLRNSNLSIEAVTELIDYEISSLLLGMIS